MVEQIMEEIELSGKQYGGVKNCGTEHFLVDTWEEILQSLDDHRASVNLVSLDYAKAFNRMDHRECLKAFARKGASKHTLRFIASFLYGRTMCVRYAGKTSTRLPIPGGSPQGCVLANLLFCVTIEGIEDGQYEEEVPELEQALVTHDLYENMWGINNNICLLYTSPSPRDS